MQTSPLFAKDLANTISSALMITHRDYLTNNVLKHATLASFVRH